MAEPCTHIILIWQERDPQQPVRFTTSPYDHGTLGAVEQMRLRMAHLFDTQTVAHARLSHLEANLCF